VFARETFFGLIWVILLHLDQRLRGGPLLRGRVVVPTGHQLGPDLVHLHVGPRVLLNEAHFYCRLEHRLPALAWRHAALVHVQLEVAERQQPVN